MSATKENVKVVRPTLRRWILLIQCIVLELGKHVMGRRKVEVIFMNIRSESLYSISDRKDQQGNSKYEYSD